MGRRLGLIIGVNSYQDTAFRPLAFAETDARALAQWLVNTKGGAWSPADVQLVQGSHATYELMQALLTHMCANMAGPEDVVFVYFAGHAYVDEGSGEGYLALANTRCEQPSTGLHLATVMQQLMVRSRASHIVFMLDCFQTGELWDARRSSTFDFTPLFGPTLLNTLAQTPNRMFFCSCRGNNAAPEQGEKSLGAFTYRMILGLCGLLGKETEAEQQITLQQVFTLLRGSLGEQQCPQVFGRERTPLILVGAMPDLYTLRPSGPLRAGEAPSAGSGAGPVSQPVGPMPSGALRMAPAAAGMTTTAQLSPTLAGEPGITEARQRVAMLMRQARHLLQMQNPTAAYSTVEQVLQIEPTNISALIFKGQLLGTTGRFQEALYLVELVIQLEAENALAWSMRAALLTNMGMYQEALEAVERSLELEPMNAETLSIKNSVRAKIATEQKQRLGWRVSDDERKKAASNAFFLGTGLQFLGLIVGVIGAALPIVRPTLPMLVAFVLQSIGLALLCVLAARGSYRYGFARVVVTIVGCLLAAAILGGIYQVGKGRLTTMVQGDPKLLVPILFLGLWLTLAATLPLLLSLVGWVSGAVVRVRRKS